MAINQEQRRTLRLPKQFEATLDRMDFMATDGVQLKLPALVVNVSREGLGLVTTGSLEKPERIRITLKVNPDTGVPDPSGMYSTEAEVRNCEKAGSGFRIGLRLMFRTGREKEGWEELVRKWFVRKH